MQLNKDLKEKICYLKISYLWSEGKSHNGLEKRQSHPDRKQQIPQMANGGSQNQETGPQDEGTYQLSPGTLYWRDTEVAPCQPHRLQTE